MNKLSEWRKLAFNFKLFAPSVVILLLLSACGSGDSDTPNTNTPTEDSGRYLFYTSGSVDQGNLFAIDPDSPAVSIPVEAGSDIVGCGDDLDLDLCSFSSGKYENSTNRVSGYMADSLVYIKTDGSFYKVSSIKRGDLTPQQLSSETEADQICRSDIYGGVYRAGDFSDINQSQLVYHLPGEDGDCLSSSDNIWKMIRLGMGESDTPIDALHPVVWLRNLDSDASISGWLVNDEGTLRRCDENFLNCSDGLAQGDTSMRMVFGLGRNSYLLEIDGQNYVYNGEVNSLSNSIFTPPQNEVFSNHVADDNFIYFVNSNRFYRAPIDGSSTATQIAEESEDASLNIWIFSAMESRLIYTIDAGTGNDAEIKAIDKTGGEPITLATLDDADRAVFFTKQNLIFYYFYEYYVTSGYEMIPLLAGIMDEDGNTQFETADAEWVGFKKSRIYDLSNNIYDLWADDMFILGERTNREISGMTLRGFDGVSGNELVNLGDVSELEDLRGFICYTNSQEDMLCEVTLDRSPVAEPPVETTQQDIFYLNTSTSDSLVRVTDTPETSEAAVIQH